MLPRRFDSAESLLFQKSEVLELLSLNSRLERHGLQLTEETAEEIIKSRSQILKNQGRVELDTKITQAIIKMLSDSSYITQDNFVSSVNDVYETFHFIKNETSDLVTDEDILDAVMTSFDRVCHGSTELLMGKGAKQIIDNFENSKDLTDVENRKEVEEYWNFDE